MAFEPVRKCHPGVDDDQLARRRVVGRIDQANQPHRFYSDLLHDRVVVITAFYTQCKNSCPIATAKLLQLQDHLGERLGRDAHFLSLTVDPTYDTPSRLRGFAQKLGIEGGDHHHSVIEQIAVEAVRLVCLVDQLDIGEVLMSPGARALERLDALAAVSRCRSRFFGPMCAVMNGHCGGEGDEDSSRRGQIPADPTLLVIRFPLHPRALHRLGGR